MLNEESAGGLNVPAEPVLHAHNWAMNELSRRVSMKARAEL